MDDIETYMKLDIQNEWHEQIAEDLEKLNTIILDGGCGCDCKK